MTEDERKKIEDFLAGRVFITEESLIEIGKAIRERLASDERYLPRQMPTAIRRIKSYPISDCFEAKAAYKYMSLGTFPVRSELVMDAGMLAFEAGARTVLINREPPVAARGEFVADAAAFEFSATVGINTDDSIGTWTGTGEFTADASAFEFTGSTAIILINREPPIPVTAEIVLAPDGSEFSSSVTFSMEG